MDYRFYENKIVYILIVTLVLIQLGAFFILTSSNRKIAEDTIREDLLVAAQVFKRLLESRHRLLQQTAHILASDYGFRESIATQDRDTIESMLLNHGTRAGAQVLVLSDMEQAILATVPSSLQIRPEEVAALSELNPSEVPFVLQLARLTLAGQALPAEKLLQVVGTHIKAPLPIAKLTIGYAVDDRFALDLRDATEMEYLFLSGGADDWRLHASTMPAQVSARFVASFDQHDETVKLIETDDNAYLMLPVLLGGAGQEQMIALLAKPLKSVMLPFERIETRLFYLLIATILLSVVVIYLVGQKMVRPLNTYAHMDHLTGLGNRRLFNVLMRRALADLHALRHPFALLIIDLNKFKQINDTEGHDTGDAVLAVSAKRIREVMRNTDNIMRIGGDEFAVILQGADKNYAQKIAEKISEASKLPIPVNGKLIEVGVSIGIALAPEDGNNQSVLLRKADAAMYTAKSTRAVYAFYHKQDEQAEPLPP